MNFDDDDTVDPVGNDQFDAASLDALDLDPEAVERDDALLDLLGRGQTPEGDDPLAALLSDWRAEVDADELPALPSDEEIEVAMAPNVSRLERRGWTRSGEHHHGKRPALWQAVTGAAAVAVVVVGGLSVAAHSAMPGDPLWGVSQTMFSDRAGDVQLVSDLSQSLEAADAAAEEGNHDEAERLLSEVSEKLDQVDNASERVELMKRRDAIKRGLSRVTPSAVPSPAPAPAPAPAPEPGPVTSPAPGAATLVPGIPNPLPSNLLPPPPEGMPVVPLPLDGLRISTTLQIPIDTKRLQDFLAPTTGQQGPVQGDVDQDSLMQGGDEPEPNRTTVTRVPTQTQTQTQTQGAPKPSADATTTN